MQAHDPVFVPNELGLYVPATVHHLTDILVTALLNDSTRWFVGPREIVHEAIPEDLTPDQPD